MFKVLYLATTKKGVCFYFSKHVMWLLSKLAICVNRKTFMFEKIIFYTICVYNTLYKASLLPGFLTGTQTSYFSLNVLISPKF